MPPMRGATGRKDCIAVWDDGQPVIGEQVVKRVLWADKLSDERVRVGDPPQSGEWRDIAMSLAPRKDAKQVQ
jgi:hypothetical protein